MYDIIMTSLQVLEKVEVWETIGREGKGHRYRQYKVKLSFLPHHYYQVSTSLVKPQPLEPAMNLIAHHQADYVVTPSQVLHYVERRFVRKLVAAVNREIKLLREKRCVC